MSGAAPGSVATLRAGRPWGVAAAGVRVVWRVECVKLLAQVRVRLMFVACVLAPFVFAVSLTLTSSVPADTVFGRWVHDSAPAIPLVVLGFAGSWGFPALVAVVAGDILAGEDHHGTWKTVLTRSRGRGPVFTGKVLAAVTYTVVSVLVLALASIAAGSLLGGSRPLIGLTGAEIPVGHATVLVLLAWVAMLPAVLTFGAIAVLVSAGTRNSLAGIAVPIAVGLLIQLLSLVDGAQRIVAALPGDSFLAWHGLFADPDWTTPLIVSMVVSAAWAAAAVLAAWLIFRRRDITAG